MGLRETRLQESGEDYITKNFHKLYNPPKYYSGDEIKNEMGGACGMNGEQESCIRGYSGEA